MKDAISYLEARRDAVQEELLDLRRYEVYSPSISGASAQKEREWCTLSKQVEVLKDLLEEIRPIKEETSGGQILDLQQQPEEATQLKDDRWQHRGYRVLYKADSSQLEHKEKRPRQHSKKLRLDR